MGGENLDWLPEGWQVKKRNGSFGRKDKYYVNPSNGMKFNSKPEVLRYLESSVKDCKPIKERSEQNKIKIEKNVAEDLPPGWIKEIWTEKKDGKTRRDPYYIDPVSGHNFRSMKEVLVYLKSKDQEKAESKPDGSVELGDHSQSSSGERNGQGLTEDKMKEVKELAESKADKSVNGGSKVTPMNKTDMPILEHKDRNGECVSGNIPNKQPQVNGNEQHGSECAAEISINMLPENNGFEEKDNNDPTGGAQQIEKLVSKNKRKTSSDLPRRTSKRLARSEVYQSPEVKTRNDTGATSASLSGSKAAALEKVIMPIAEQKEIVAPDLPNKLAQENGNEQHNGGRRQIGRLGDSKLEDNNVTKDQSLQSVFADGEAAPKRRSITSPENNFFFQIPKKENKRKTPNNKLTRSDLPCTTSERLVRSNASSPQVKMQNNAEASSATLLEEAHTSKKVGNGGASEMDPTGKFGRSDSKRRPENPITNNPENPINGNPYSPEEHKNVGVNFQGGESQEKHLGLPLKELFKDPCIEFAVKILTGEIPIEESNKFSSLASPNQTSTFSSVVPPDNIWVDPCFGFAVNMLTDEPPINDSSKARDSIQLPLSSSPKFRLDNGYPLHGQFDAVKTQPFVGQDVGNDYFSYAKNGQVDAIKKQPFVGQQDVAGNGSFSYVKNGSSQNSVRRSG